MPPITDIVKHLIILNVLVFIAFNLPVVQSLLPGMELYWPGSNSFQPYQIVTHFFMHGSISHLLFNMFGLYIFGCMIERSVGSKKFLFLYFASGLASFFLHVIFQYFQHFYFDVPDFYPAVGASGAIMGLALAFATLFPNYVLNLIFPPIPVKAMYLALFFVGMDLYKGFQGSEDMIAHWAHLGGALAGLLIANKWIK